MKKLLTLMIIILLGLSSVTALAAGDGYETSEKGKGNSKNLDKDEKPTIDEADEDDAGNEKGSGKKKDQDKGKPDKEEWLAFKQTVNAKRKVLREKNTSINKLRSDLKKSTREANNEFGEVSISSGEALGVGDNAEFLASLKESLKQTKVAKDGVKAASDAIKEQWKVFRQFNKDRDYANALAALDSISSLMDAKKAGLENLSYTIGQFRNTVRLQKENSIDKDKKDGEKLDDNDDNDKQEKEDNGDED